MRDGATMSSFVSGGFSQEEGREYVLYRRTGWGLNRLRQIIKENKWNSNGHIEWGISTITAPSNIYLCRYDVRQITFYWLNLGDTYLQTYQQGNEDSNAALICKVLAADKDHLFTLEKFNFVYDLGYSVLEAKWGAAMGDVAAFLGTPSPTKSSSTSTTTSSKFCSSCGKPVVDGAKFCASCGSPFEKQ